jgi:hypothetical protein
MTDNLSANDGWIKAAVEQRRRTQVAEAQVEALRTALEGVREAITDSDEPEALAIIRHALSVLAEENSGVRLSELRDIFERPFDGDEDPRIRLAQALTRAEADAVLEYRGDLRVALSVAPESAVYPSREDIAKVISPHAFKPAAGGGYRFNNREANRQRAVALADSILGLFPAEARCAPRRGADRSKPAGAICGHCEAWLWDGFDHAPGCPSALPTPPKAEADHGG